MAVAKEELEGSPTSNWTRRSATAQQVFRIADGDQDNFLQELFPHPFVSGNIIVIPRPANYPGKLWVLADNVEFRPFDPMSPSGLNESPNYYPGGIKATVNYKTPDYDLSALGIAFYKEKRRIGGEFLTYPAQSLSWSTPADSSVDQYYATPKDYAVAEDMVCSVTIPLIEHELTWPFVLYPPWNAIRQCVGKVNAYAFNGAPPETLLFLGADADRELSITGTRTWNLAYKYAEKNQNAMNPAAPQGWNYFLRPDGSNAGTFQRLRKKLPGGAGMVKGDVAAGSGSIPLYSVAGFPRSSSFRIKVKNNVNVWEYYTIATTNGASPFVLAANDDGDGIVTATDINSGAPVMQVFRTQLNGAINATQTVIPVDSRSAFPRSGQFLIQVDNEIMAVIAGHGAGIGNLVVLRAIQGTFNVPHGDNTVVELVPGNVYDLADFRTLFLSGLITG